MEKTKPRKLDLYEYILRSVVRPKKWLSVEDATKRVSQNGAIVMIISKWSEKVKGNKKKYFGVHVKKNS
ncbi:hypothetical protein [Wolbachia endosymbiont (group B) of Melanargia galathea]|uniref:hypothetical protein n=1 Tax=Wolbachia endosymbiont (group B) of Melanargia galathea TaxID=2954029 RepID=UPI00313E5A73